MAGPSFSPSLRLFGHGRTRKLSFSSQPLLRQQGPQGGLRAAAPDLLRIVPVAAILLIVFAELYLYLSIRPSSASSPSLSINNTNVTLTQLEIQKPVVCDPYTIPGLLHPDSLHWITLPSTDSNQSNPACDGADNFGALQATQFGFPIPPALANKILLLLGDSFERNLVDELCVSAGVQPYHAMLNGSFVADPIYGDSRICTIRDTAGNMFVAINVFQFGMSPENLIGFLNTGMHWLEGYSPLHVADRIKWLPHFLLSVAGLAFPEICALRGHDCPPPVWRLETVERPDLVLSTPPFIDTANPFWFPAPDVLVVNSMIWDLAESDFNQYAAKNPGAPFPFEQFQQFGENWMRQFNNEIVEPVKQSFGHVLRAVTGAGHAVVPRFFTRTLPLPASRTNRFAWPSFSMIDSLNNLMRLGAFRASIYGTEDVQLQPGVLDWAHLVAGMTIHTAEDDEHPTQTGNMAFWQLILSRFEMLEQAVGERPLTSA
ncbi:hypothetical protein HDU83_006683 [Entophlyctis luteolus]|nr:hypothetical protein HDU83_006683 [Entophlyctis luteolus]